MAVRSVVRVPIFALSTLFLAFVAGCARSDSASASASRTLKPADFATTHVEKAPPAPSSQAAPVPARTVTTPPDAIHIGAPVASPSQPTTAAAPTDDEFPEDLASPAVVATAGLPETSPSAQPRDRALIVDAVVGQINGKPVFASEILEPLHGRLSALTEETKTRAEFVSQGERLIADSLRRRIEEELTLSEARASLPPETRAGLFHIINELRGSMVSQQRGSSVAADEALRQSQGRSLDQQAKQMLERELIQNELRTRIAPRVQVTWRDIQQEYERNFDKYHPKPTARLRIIQVVGPRSGDESGAARYRESIESIAASLAAGVSFDTLATQPPNEFLRAKGGLVERQFTEDYTAGEYSPTPEINDAARSLEIGQWAGPIAYTDRDDRRERTAWIYLDSIDRPKAITLEEAQLEIERSLQDKRMQRELSKYLGTLSSRGNVSDIKAMTTALTEIAEERYVPPSRK